MRLTVIPVDSVICIDGVCVSGADLSWAPENVHAVQWYDTYGEIELVTMEPNIQMLELGIYERCVEIWQNRKLELDTIKEQLLEEQRISHEEMERQKILIEYSNATMENSNEMSELLNSDNNDAVEEPIVEEPIVEENNI